jgi:CDGSH-type Zn-finger protein
MTDKVKNEVIVEPSPNGPLRIRGEIIVKKLDGTEERKINITSFCRCGASNNKPYCDGSHKTINFQG